MRLLDGEPPTGPWRVVRAADLRLPADRPRERAGPTVAGTPDLPSGPDEPVVAP